MNMLALNVDIVVLFLMALSALWTVMTRSLLRSAIGLALTSAMLTILMFRLHAPLAAVFELSVCSGLISVVFIATISLTQPMSQEKVLQHMKDRLERFWYLPILLVLTGIILSFLNFKFNLILPAPEIEKDPRIVLWNQRPLDLLGQIIMLLTGAFGIVILFREAKKK
jgi:NADH-quinone oxidoreductase subunit J